MFYCKFRVHVEHVFVNIEFYSSFRITRSYVHIYYEGVVNFF